MYLCNRIKQGIENALKQRELQESPRKINQMIHCARCKSSSFAETDEARQRKRFLIWPLRYHLNVYTLKMPIEQDELNKLAFLLPIASWGVCVSNIQF